MPKTFLELQKDVARYVGSPDDAEAWGVAGSGINDAINMFNGRNWSWQHSTSGFAFQQGVNEYPVPTDFRTPRQLNYLNTAGDVAGTIGYREPKVFDRVNAPGGGTGSSAGEPYEYTIRDPYPSGVILLDSKPNAGFVETHPSGQLCYFARIPNLTTSGQRLVVPPEVESTILWYAKSYTAASYNRDQKVAFSESRWRPLFRQLRRNEVEDVSTDWRR